MAADGWLPAGLKLVHPSTLLVSALKGLTLGISGETGPLYAQVRLVCGLHE